MVPAEVLALEDEDPFAVEVPKEVLQLEAVEAGPAIRPRA